jgi:ketosteroid isomerase-like protein
MTAVPPEAPAETDTRAIDATVRDYFEGWYDGDTARMDRALHPDLVKRRAGEALGVTTKERMVELTAAGEGAADRSDGRIEIRIADIYGDIACAIVHTGTYHEYVQLVRTSTGWRIANALWQLSAA